ncbi:LacI family DNA-binding transcriptional regulator [Promicromonospora thailandica]|uniref:Transcriptional regulator, LacI family n=1 Tax=Promicromonospora thailandica TaxID=765201 RepID=A0A9X2JVV0_9MICO|nr:substrate-binding domain-containing protein [Promicromonospora thailandica]MCP2265471.1 transcriptional regulator, LacI family [Promicromonospora thailandica]BFF17023.1 LacI family DNA-binding transcriptional regulator [Promicromonospora thailandica]
MDRSGTAARPTLEQVARAAGVSKATASKVLNHRPHISEQTRRRVEQAIDELGYVPTTGPRERDRLRKVNVVFSTLANLYSMHVLEGIVAAAHAQHVEVLVDRTDPAQEDGPLSPAWSRRMAAQEHVGVIAVTAELTAEQRDQISALGLSVVLIDPLNPLDDEVVSVGATNFTGGLQATRHLLDLGHRRIAYAGGPPGSVASHERLQGYLSAMSSASAPVDPALVLAGEFTVPAGLEMAGVLLDGPHPPTAIFAGCDASALGVIEAARQRGLRVPQDLSVVGFDDTAMAVSSAPPLTTVRQPISDMGRVALRTLLQQARGERADSHHVQLSTQLVVRGSTAAPARP